MTIYSNAFIHDEGNDGISDKAQYYFLKLVFLLASHIKIYDL